MYHFFLLLIALLPLIGCQSNEDAKVSSGSSISLKDQPEISGPLPAIPGGDLGMTGEDIFYSGENGVRSHLFEVKNYSDQSVTGISLFINAPFEIATDYTGADKCNGSLEPEASCVVEIRFKATQLGHFSQPVILQYKDSNDELRQWQAVLQGYGVGGGELSFMNDDELVGIAGQNSHYVFTLFNPGPEEISSLQLVANGAFHISTSDFTCPEVLAAEESCEFEVIFHPESAGIHGGELFATFKTVDGVVKGNRVYIEGVAEHNPWLNMSQGELGFASIETFSVAVGGSISHLFQVDNNSAHAISELDVRLPRGFSIGEQNTCLDGIPAGSSCVVEIVFQPEEPFPTTYPDSFVFYYLGPDQVMRNNNFNIQVSVTN